MPMSPIFWPLIDLSFSGDIWPRKAPPPSGTLEWRQSKSRNEQWKSRHALRRPASLVASTIWQASVADRWKPGYKYIIFQPAFDIQELSNVDASYTSIYGKITSRWKKTPTHLEWDIELPANTTGEVYLPGGRKEMGGSGKHHFSVDIPTRNVAILSDEFLYEKSLLPGMSWSHHRRIEKRGSCRFIFGGYQRAQSGLLHLGVSQAERCQKNGPLHNSAADGVFSIKMRRQPWQALIPLVLL